MQTLKLSTFKRALYSGAAPKRLPLRAMIELTYACNHRCIHCYNPPCAQRPELTREDVFSVVDQLAGMGTLEVAFTGGEIFTRPDIMEIILHSRKAGLRVTLMTNASLMTEDIMDKLISWGVGRFEISFLGATRRTFDGMTRVEGSFDRVVWAVKNLRRRGIIPRIKTCVTNLNMEEIAEIADLAKGLGLSFSYSPLVIPRLDLGHAPEALRISPCDFLDIHRRFSGIGGAKKKPSRLRKRKRADSKLGFWERERLFGCMAGRTATFINPYGEMKACLTLPEPSFNVLEHGVQACWEKIKRFVDTLKAPPDWQCFTCEYRDWCSWCPGRGYLNTGDIFGCPPYFREVAMARKDRYEKAVKRK